MTDKIVCESLEGAIKRQHAGEQFDFIISIGDTQDPRDHVDGNGRVFSFAFEDTLASKGALNAPTFETFQALRRLLENVWATTGKSLLVHCQGGVSRSSATTLLALVIEFEDTCSARTIVAELFKINPFALPHEDFLQWIDSEFDFGGWLVELVEEKTKEVMNNKFTI